MSEASSKIDETILSYFLKNASREAFPTDAALHTLHPFASVTPDDPISLLKNLVSASSALDRTLQSYTALSSSDHKFVSILRQSTTLVNSLHTSKQDARRRVDALKARNHAGTITVYEEPVPLDGEFIVDWCISRIEGWGRENGMEIFRDEEDKSGKMTIMLGGKVLVVDVDLHIQRNTTQASHVTVSNIKTSHALPSGNSGNALAERSTSLDAFLLRTWNSYLEEVQKNDIESSMRAAHISRDIQNHLYYLMKLDALASQEGDQGIRWFSDTGFMSVVAEQVSKTEVDCLSAASRSSVVNLDVFLSRAHALAIPYLVSPSMSFLVYLSPIAYYSLVRVKNEVKPDQHRPIATDSLTKLDIPLTTIHEHLTRRELRPQGTTIAALILKSVSNLYNSPDRRTEQRPLSLGRPHFRLPGASALGALDHILIAPSLIPEQGRNVNLEDTRDVWMLDFTDCGHSPGIVMTHSRMREIQQVIEPMGMGDGLGFGMQMQMPPLPGSWISLLISPGLPPSERYIAIYRSPSNMHPPLRLRLTVPNEAGFILQHVPVTSLKQVYGVLEIVRDQCWINETLNVINWTAEELMPDAESDGDEADTLGTPEMELDALLKGAYTPSRIPVNVFLPVHPPSFPSSGNNIDSVIGGIDLDAEHDQSVPGLSSVSMSSGVNTPAPCIAFAFSVHSSQGSEARNEGTKGLRQVVLVLRHDRSRRRGVRVDVNVSAAPDLNIPYGESIADRPPKELIEDLEEKARRGGAFGTVGKVWGWLTNSETK